MAIKLYASLDDGTRVVLSQDGTWHFDDVQASSHSAGPSASNENQCDVRNVSWGMSRREVIGAEKGKPLGANSEEHGDLGFLDTVAGTEVSMLYSFFNDRLSSLGMLPHLEYDADNRYFDDFDWWKSMLSKKYGQPEDDRKVWYDDCFQDQPSKWGVALRLGELACTVEWSLPRTLIHLRLACDDREPSLSVAFHCKATYDEIRSASEGDVLDSI